MRRGTAGDDDPGQRDFDAMFEEHYDAVHRYARRRVGPDHADDVASEAFVVAWRRGERVPPGRELPWLYACARRITLAHLRADRRQGLIAQSLGRRPGAAFHADDADRVIERSGALEALSRLTELERELVMLVTWEGLDCRQAAAVVGCAHVTARARLHRARKRLTAHLSRDTGTTEPERARPPKEATWTT
ncbi:RNA polymerase sigma-70 factor (ECF subfamily) [Nocardiopsis sp. Huas11]|uniref:RNA polymerase sigma factor n=1 Tax=Nocardiopsis sp. Huas11 TaxID=2183912 RepID=UPI000EAC3AE6|nr:sigma-70 family RNA polymerase sigma factor [Nocardiopsis sp. Huas11]RKS10697.1 RNA polymerase sigma-70 factor (ECF subfamily) [Nocardiopsis sp. Huas11]